MLIPAIIYSVNNMLSLFILSKIQIAHVAVLRPTGVALFNCILWISVFGRGSSPVDEQQGWVQKAVGILLCIFGGCVNSYDLNTGGVAVSLQGGLLLLCSTFLSASGA